MPLIEVDGGLKPARRRVVTRERVLDAAEKLFLEKGFAAATVQDIARAAGYTTGAIYSNFGGKAELFLDVFRRRLEPQQQVWRDTLESARTSKDAAAAMGAALSAATYEPEWYAAVFEFFSFSARHPELRRETAEILRATNPLLEEILSRVSASAPLPLERLAPIIGGLMRGLAWTWVVDPDAADDTLFSDAVAVLIGGVPGSRPKVSKAERALAARGSRKSSLGRRSASDRGVECQ